MPFIFPDNPAPDTVVEGPYGAAWKWDGVKWVGGAGGPYVSRSGDHMTGPLYLAGNPSLPLEAANKDYVDWVATHNVEEAPFNGEAYGRELGEWTPVLPITGGFMRGAISMDGWEINNLPMPLLPQQAANKEYVDRSIATLQVYAGVWRVAANVPDLRITTGLINGQYYIASTVDPAVPETALPAIPGIGGQLIYNGSIVVWNGSLHIWQHIRSGQLTRPVADATYLAIAGGTMTGSLILAADPAADLEAATKSYVDDAILGVSLHYTVPIADTAPTGPLVGNLWWDSQDNQLYIYYDDGTSIQWVASSNTGLGDSPTDGKVYGRRGSTDSWLEVLPASGGTMTGELVAPTFRAGDAAGPTWTSGAGVPTATAPIGSLFSRTNGAVGSTLYVSRGGGIWAAVAGV